MLYAKFEFISLSISYINLFHLFHCQSQMGEGYETENGPGLRCAARRGIQFRRRRRMPVARLGGPGSGSGPGRLGRMVRKIRVRWVKLRCLAMVKKMKKWYRKVLKDVIEAQAAVAYPESYQHRVLLETSFAIPILPRSLSTYPVPPNA
ncbi:uncharacterized protein LOC111016963 [Momordica charantia]|uniref:Uncharacterized protein LOC111016963 n=1 Tax=Momordica charantia TaxID=3673 RepID=A0A6J1D3L4_MOMCH|nr:uncharacterized protein LOC111016963 [Momordica charantia]